MKRLLLPLLLLGIVSLQAQSLKDHPRVKETLGLIHLWLDAEKDFSEIPGLSVAIVYDQTLLYAQGLGYADLENQTPATPQTIYSICSISKLFTSIGLMQLRDAGALTLDDAVAQHLPWFRIQQVYPESPEITLEGILTHSSGLPRESDFPYWTGPDFPFPGREDIIRQVENQETLYPAHKYFQYSNLGLTLAGEVIREVSGQDYDAYIQEKILDPLELKDTRTYMPEELLGQQLASGYSAFDRRKTRQKVNLFQAKGLKPAAGYSSTVLDLAKFASWQFRAMAELEDPILHPNTLREMQRVHWVDPDWETTWGIGFAVWEKNGKRFTGHGGSCPGYKSHFNLQTDEKTAIVFMTNAMEVSPGRYTGILYDLVSAALREARNHPDSVQALPSAWEAYTGLYDSSPWGSEMAVFPWKGSLAVVHLPVSHPGQGITRLKHISGATFRRIRSDGELGESVRFEEDPQTGTMRVWQHSNFSPKVGPLPAVEE